MLLPKLLPPDLATAALRRLRPTATQLADFSGHLTELRHLDPTKIERHAETHILNFLLAATRPAGAGSRYGNVNGKRDPAAAAAAAEAAVDAALAVLYGVALPGAG